MTAGWKKTVRLREWFVTNTPREAASYLQPATDIRNCTPIHVSADMAEIVRRACVEGLEIEGFGGTRTAMMDRFPRAFVSFDRPFLDCPHHFTRTLLAWWTSPASGRIVPLLLEGPDDPWCNECHRMAWGEVDKSELAHRSDVAMTALTAIMGQTLANVQTFSPTGSRSAKARKSDPSEVVVVTLRARRSARSDDDSPGYVEWSHRWLVDGHWHHYRTGPGRREVELRWLAPYVKGPEDKPLVVKDRVVEVIR